MGRLRLFNDKSIKYRWSITYVTLLFLPLIICISVFFMVDNVLKDEINRSNDFFLNQLKQYMDNLTGEVEGLSADLAFNVNVQQILNIDDELNDEIRYKIYECYKAVKTYSMTNMPVDHFFIYFKDLDIIIGNSKAMDSKGFIEASRFGEIMGYNKWQKIMNGYHTGNYLTISEDEKNSSIKGLIYALSIPLDLSKSMSANIIVSIDEVLLLNMISDMEKLNGGKLVVLNDKNEVVVGSSNTVLPTNLKYEDMVGKSGIINETINGKKTVVSYINSGSKGWKYVYIMPKNIYWQKILQSRRFIYGSTVVSILIGIVIIYFFVKRNYEPVNQLLKTLIGNSHSDSYGNGDEYDLIHTTVCKVLSEKEEINNWLSGQKEALRARFIERLLKGHIIESTAINSMEYLEVNFKYKSFAVILYEGKELETVFSSWGNLNFIEHLKLFEFILSNIMKELAGEKYILYTVDCENRVACLMNFDDDAEESKFIGLQSICEQTIDFIEKYYKFEVSVAVSSVQENTASIFQCYKEAVEVADFKEVTGMDGVTIYDRINKITKPEYYYPTEKEHQLINSIKSGSYEIIQTILDEIFDKNFKDNQLSHNMVKCFIFNLVGTLLKVTNEISTSTEVDFTNELKAIEQLICYKNVSRVKEPIKNILKDICHKVNSEKKDNNNLKHEVMKFIDENFKDENLSLTLIAENFNMHPSYVSKLFKLYSGEGILDYIGKARIEASKKILKDRRLNMEEVAREVGYSSVKTFTRVFSKFEGVTPGKFREID